MNNKKYICGIRHTKSGQFKSIVVVDDADSYVTDIRTFVHNHPESAYALFPDDFEVVCFALDLDAYIQPLGDACKVISFKTWQKGE